MKKLLLILLTGLILFSQNACTSRIAISKNTQRLHHSAERVDPYYEIKSKSKKAKNGLWLAPVLGTLVIGTLGYFGENKDKTPFTPAQRTDNTVKSAVAGAGIGLFFGGLGFLINERTTKGFEKVSASNFDNWLTSYGRRNHQNYVRYDKGDAMPLIIPKNQVKNYEAEERRKEEAAERERQRILAETKRQEEQYQYNLMMAGKSIDLDGYLTKHSDGAHYAEVKRMEPVYRAYLAALNGGLAESRTYLANPSNTFYREKIALRVRQIDNTLANAPLRKQALESFLGIHKPVNSVDCQKAMERAAAQNDVLANAWKGFFTYLGLGGFSVDEEMGIALAYENILTDMFKDAYKNREAEVLSIAGLAGIHENNAQIMSLTQDAAYKQNYLPAYYILGIQAYQAKDYTKAIEIFKDAHSKGMGKAAMMLGVIYENEGFGGKNAETAIEWYKKGVAANDGDAALKMAEMYYSGKHFPPNAEKTLEWAKIGADLGHTGSMVFLGKFLTEDHQNVSRDTKQALNYYREAADKGDREAMFALGILSYEGKALGFKDDKQAAYWIPRAAEAGQPQAMALAAKFYDEGTLLPKNSIKARFWYNQAKAKGIGNGSSQPKVDSPLESIFRHGDFSPTYTVVEDYYGNVQSVTPNLGSGLMGGLISGMFGSWFDRYQNQQTTINGMEHIMTKSNRKIYAGTITSRFRTPITLTAGQKISCKTTGTVSMGTFAGNSSANGLYDSMLSGYRITSAVNFGAVMGRINEGQWFKLGTDYNAEVEQNGQLELGVNDSDYASHRGYFDIRIEIKD
ncbi:tetratricopeptide repeat protein [Larkinella rosea]|uniref:Sel1 repeat family protein n=1 Tax=Larkinella rosea TaxID=2025312 RepID=A0A3P1BPE5_9BACT|nr:tetratricopeptide repeat protein [Larkinella rosea]RRB02783.1 sel1 repeat family protein [Larkinella rosea]